MAQEELPPRYIEDKNEFAAVTTGLGYYVDVELNTGTVHVDSRWVVPGL